MTRRKNPPARYQLPENVEPEESVCFQIRVPKEKYHLAAFRGQLVALSRAYAWGNDDDHTALAAANVWKNVIAEMEACPDVPQVQFRQIENCTLEASFDEGATWNTIFQAADCVTDGIQAAIDDSVLGVPGQPAPAGTLPSVTCKTWHVELRGSDKWLCPVPVDDGYTVSISGASGGYSDGYLGGVRWYCPDGHRYTLGSCGSGTDAGESTDPIPSIYHMRLIAQVGSGYADVLGGGYVVPNGTGPTNLWLQANDGTLSDNLGSIRFDVTVCSSGSVSTAINWAYLYTVDYSVSPTAVTYVTWPDGDLRWYQIADNTPTALTLPAVPNVSADSRNSTLLGISIGLAIGTSAHGHPAPTGDYDLSKRRKFAYSTVPTSPAVYEPGVPHMRIIGTGGDRFVETIPNGTSEYFSYIEFRYRESATVTFELQT